MPNVVTTQPDVSPLLLADRLIALAQDADRAGYAGTAGRLLRMAFRICEEPARVSG